MREADVYVNKTLAGVLIESDHGDFTFRYNQQYLADTSQTAIALSFPKSEGEFHASILFPFFYNMLSEGANRAIQCQTLKIDEQDDFGLLLATAHTDTIGAITIKRR